MTATLKRGTFLKAGGALVVSFGIPLAPLAARASDPGRPDPAQLDSWLSVGHDGTVTAFTGRIDFGQHKRTAFAQIVAEELDVPYKAVVMVMGDTARTVEQGGSEASDGILYGVRPLRHAAAEARRILLNLAAKRFAVPVDRLSVADGVVTVPGDPAKRVTYGELIGSQRFNVILKVTDEGTPFLDVAGLAKPKDPSLYKLVGTSIPADEIPHMVTATWPRVHNVRLPGMLHARLILPPGPGAHVAKVGGFRKSIPGARVVALGDFVAVLAPKEWDAIQAAENLEVTWTNADTLPGNDAVFRYLRSAQAPAGYPQRVVRKIGDVEAAVAAATKTLHAQYNYPTQNHGMIGPSCGVADIRGREGTVYAGTQDAAATRSAIAKLLDVPEQNIRVIPVEPSGCYGRLGTDDATVAAAFISHRIGKPVRVQFNRGQEHTWEPLSPPSTFSLAAGVDGTGKIVAWDQQEWSWPMATDELPVMLVPRGSLIPRLPPFFRLPGGGETSAYTFDNMRMLGNTVPPPLRGATMRSPGRIQVNFAGEQFMDEIAVATGQDPIALRLRHVADQRAAAVLNEVAKISNWQKRPSPATDARGTGRIMRGRGVALVANQRSTYVATVAEVEVNRSTGNVRVKRMFVAVDPGLVVNPNGIKAQIEGATIFATSRTLKEEVKFDRSRVSTSDWLSYPILRFSEVPEIVISLINRPELAPGGIGEPPNTTPAAAIANAVYDASGVRFRELPLTPARVKAALG